MKEMNAVKVEMPPLEILVFRTGKDRLSDLRSRNSCKKGARRTNDATRQTRRLLQSGIIF